MLLICISSTWLKIMIQMDGKKHPHVRYLNGGRDWRHTWHRIFNIFNHVLLIQIYGEVIQNVMCTIRLCRVCGGQSKIMHPSQKQNNYPYLADNDSAVNNYLQGCTSDSIEISGFASLLVWENVWCFWLFILTCPFWLSEKNKQPSVTKNQCLSTFSSKTILFVCIPPSPRNAIVNIFHVQCTIFLREYANIFLLMKCFHVCGWGIRNLPQNNVYSWNLSLVCSSTSMSDVEWIFLNSLTSGWFLTVRMASDSPWCSLWVPSSQSWTSKITIIFSCLHIHEQTSLTEPDFQKRFF